MAIDLIGMTRKELEKLKADVEKALEKAEARDLRAAKKAAEKAAAEFGFSLGEIAGGASTAEKPKRKYTKRKAAKKSGVAKYRNPSDAKQTWTGKGRQPQWFKAAIDAGTDPSSMEI
ncbi:H-NS family nucleoid-associated regulatory protein [Aestuariivita boseongensis]|uniref:H-NS histone family protein n=1 Tax=Aestuariivita boseongensis TaxID=1470562 RepID=UPI0006806AD5|nr:H-NS histone family protein [Aestuariivita boseongensis]